MDNKTEFNWTEKNIEDLIWNAYGHPDVRFQMEQFKEEKLKEHKVEEKRTQVIEGRYDYKSYMDGYQMGYKDGKKYGNINNEPLSDSIPTLERQEKYGGDNKGFHAGDAVTFNGVAWDTDKLGTKAIKIEGKIHSCYNFKSTARVQYFSPDDGQLTYKELPFSEIEKQESKQDSKPRQMWNKHTGIHDENECCKHLGCEYYNPINITHE